MKIPGWLGIIDEAMEVGLSTYTRNPQVLGCRIKGFPFGRNCNIQI